MVNVQLLRDKIDESGMTVLAICDKSGISKQVLYNRFKNPKFTVDEIQGLTRTLQLTAGEMRKIFFTSKVE